MPRAVTVDVDVQPDASALAQASANGLLGVAIAAVHARGRVRVAISGGSTPKAMFSLLAAAPYADKMPWDKLDLFWVDERCVAPDDAESNYGVCKTLLLDKVPLPPEQVHRMEGELDPEEAASRYEAALRTAFRLEGAETPVFDLVLLGMGPDGHTASLFPHTDGLEEIARLAMANHVPQKDTWRLTLTAPVINAAREVAFEIAGADKAEVLARVLTGPYDPATYPSQLIRPRSGKLTLMVDRAAAAQLPEGEDTRRIELKG